MQIKSFSSRSILKVIVGGLVAVCWLGLATLASTLVIFGHGFGDALAIDVPDALQGVGIFENLGQQLSINDLKFTDEQGVEASLAKFLEKPGALKEASEKNGSAERTPILLNLVYYGCTSLCTFVLNGVVDSMKKAKALPGEDFQLVTVSIDDREDAKLATRKKDSYLKMLSGGDEAIAKEVSKNWHFLVGKKPMIEKLAAEVGFRYKYIESENQFSHPAGTFVITAEGKLSRVLYGIEYSPRDLKLAIAEASTGKISTVVERFLLNCYRYDPNSRKYTFYATRLVQWAAFITVVSIGWYMFLFWRRQRRYPKTSV